MRDVNNILIRAEETEQPNYTGVALVLKSWMFSLATDCYGDVPYSEASQGKTGMLFPKYDTQEEIYNGILADLSEANTLLNGAINVTGDLIYGGDVKKWRKLANSLRLRYLMRISDRRDVSADMKAILNDPAGNPIFESNAEQACTATCQAHLINFLYLRHGSDRSTNFAQAKPWSIICKV